ncbi:hypothetical protein [Ruminococcus sp.]|uniref:hypothetical protein n=1 Tax=Ruminococcus sp. TaxID=41978 RepID=UPI0025E3565A|nr:hypothetical protein [Ruminococcus sp.]MCR4640356.1 hypothetical protein [Ruminococcus sp.]
MNKVEKVLIGVFGLGICVYLAECIDRGMRYGFSGGFLDYITYPIFSAYGLILAVSVIGLITLFIVHAIVKRRKKRELRITRTDKIWFAISFLPAALLLLYGLYSAIAGVDFLWSKCYGFEGFIVAVVFGGILIIPVLPLCIIWQIIYLTGRHKAKKAEKELSL